ncbi:glycosyltransferase family 2 protein [Panacibacter sp. DH6]|uniref:Glycosyltransferase family 2 protein n=1 Tax=Panacibacter microcysteis TaxID=2793269 RepID=A0A931E5L3_9BACT|nr:glycosyltransferase family 2 protein [Panacibacter microcysteis]
MIEISVVIPTCNRKARVISLLRNLSASTYPFKEVILVDSGEDRFAKEELDQFIPLNITYRNTAKSVCLQRNTGISLATTDWVFVCDDDIEVPLTYVEKIITHINNYPDACAISGVVLQQENGRWQSKYPVTSVVTLLWKYFFCQSIWGDIACNDTLLSRGIKKYYAARKNFITKAGWPVLTDFAGSYFHAPVYGLGASVIRRSFLLKFPYEEKLDKHGIGDNYGLSINLPAGSIHVLNNAYVYHHQEKINRLQKIPQHYRRVMALDYFRTTNKRLGFVKKRYLLWSVFGHMLLAAVHLERDMVLVNLKLILQIGSGKNIYAARK